MRLRHHRLIPPNSQMMEKAVMKKISVAPDEKDIVDVILSLNEHQRPGLVVRKGYRQDRIRQFYVRKVMLAEKCFRDKLCTVFDEFPCPSQIDPLYTDLFRHPYCGYRYMRARAEVCSATEMIHEISSDYLRLLKKEGDSLDQCKRLKVAAIGCMFTVAKRSLPSLDYLEKIRQLMARATDATLTKKKCDILAQQDCVLPQPVYVRNVADCVDPETWCWLEELEREHGLRLEDDEADFAKLSHQLEALPLSA